MSTAFNYSAGFEETYFTAGGYLVEITRPKLNARGNPCLTLKVVGSPNGKRLNMRYIVNFHMDERASEASRRTWTRQFDRMLKALGITGLSDLMELDGQQFLMYVYEDGYSPLINPRPASMFSGTTEKAARPVDERNPPMPDLSQMPEPTFEDEGVPF